MYVSPYLFAHYTAETPLYHIVGTESPLYKCYKEEFESYINPILTPFDTSIPQQSSDGLPGSSVGLPESIVRIIDCWTLPHDYGFLSNDLKYDLQKVWSWSRDQIGGGWCVIYGPYSSDLSLPGLYCIRYRIRGEGFLIDSDEEADLKILALDATVALDGIFRSSPPRYVTARELSRSGYFDDYVLFVQSDGNGTWEYRVGALDRDDSYSDIILSDNISVFERKANRVSIFFDTISVSYISV